MAGASFVQTDFLGGEWSPAARGRMDDPQYKTAMQASLNGFPLRNKAWTRRPGFIFMGNSRRGQKARIMSFAFSQSNPFEIEFTAGFARFYSATGAVFTPDVVPLVSISAANPAVVTVAAVPSTWNNGDEIQFNFTLPLSADILSGRRFIIASKTATTFTISDALTGAGIDGSTFTYTPNPTGARDSVLKVLELAVPYGPNDFDQIRIVQNDTVALILHPSYQPQALTIPPSPCGTKDARTITITPQVFSDGPYLNINTTATSLAPSGTSGSITITAFGVAGINNGAGFLPTDVGRLVRLQSAPQAWLTGSAHNKGDTVLGSDNNIYVAQTKNTGVDPTSDNGANWALSGQTVVWSWATITAISTPTSITATVNGPPFSSTAATTSWQLGLYSDTTGWPAVGVYHEGRFWLAGSTAVFNRIDGSVSNSVFNFSPTATDGTVGDGNAVAVISNADTQNQVVWLLTAQEGILAGTVSGEWLIRSSQFGDPITPTSIQIRRVSTYGCAPIEPQIASLTTVFVQKQQRKLMDFDHYPYGETAGWFANDISLLANHLTASGIAELRWQQEPNHILWARKTDGTLAGTVFQHGPSGFQSANIYNGWHRLSLGGTRTVASIATGPTADGLSTTLYLVAFNATTGYYELLALDAVPDDGTAIGDQTYVDGIVLSSFVPGLSAAIQNLSVATGAAIDGVQLQGLWNANGQTVSVVFGGLDLGDFVVANGRVNIPYSGAFTAAFVAALSPPVSSVHALPVQPVSNGPSVSGPAVGAYVPNTTAFASGASFEPGIDTTQRWLISVENLGFRLFNLDKFTEIIDNTPAQVFGPGSIYTMVATVRMYYPALKSVFMQIVSGNQGTLGRISVDKTGFKLTGTFGIPGSGFTSDKTHLPAIFNSMVPLSSPFLAVVGGGSVSSANKITVLNGSAMSFQGTTTLTDAEALLAPGPVCTSTFYALGTPNYGPGATATPVSLYSVNYSAVVTLIGTVSPTTIDATWTKFSAVTGPIFDPVSGGLLVFFSTTDVVTNQNYWVLFNSNATSIAWKTAVTYTVPFTAQAMGNTDISGGHLYFRANNNFNDLTVATGAITVTAFNTFMTSTGIEISLGDRRGVIGGFSGTAWSTNPIFLGPQSGNFPVAEFALLTTATPLPLSSQLIPASVGITYTSQGQIMPPDFQRDAGAINGPAFGKIRRLHWFGVNVDKSMAFSVGIKFTDMFNVAMTDYQLNPVIAPATFTGTISDTIQADYDFDSAIAWQVTRPTPLTITAVSGYIESVDK